MTYYQGFYHLGVGGGALEGGGDVGDLAAEHEGGHHLVVTADVLQPPALVLRQGIRRHKPVGDERERERAYYHLN